jgi:hypothetical protein
MLGLSHFRRLIWTTPNLKNAALAHGHTRSVLPAVAPGVPLLTAHSPPKDLDAARAWVESFRSFALRREDVSLSFARSSGPGGQVSPVSITNIGLFSHTSTVPECEQGQYKSYHHLSSASTLDPGMV